MNIALGFASLLVLAASSCDEMSHQPRYDYAEKSSLFSDGKSLQAPPDGTIARDDPAFQAALRNRPKMTAALLARGRERYAIACEPCHDPAGYGQGMIPSRGFPHPPSFHIDRLRDAPSDYLVDVITHGHGVMYSYADRVAPADRWAIAAYIRALQLSQAAPVASLSDDERAKLDGTAK
jgi:mono/diheme cytochrome c family protein